MKFIVLFVFFLASKLAFGQVVELRIDVFPDEKNNCFSLFLNREKIDKFCLPTLFLKVQEGDTIEVKSPSFKEEQIILSPSFFVNDTARITVQLTKYQQQFEEIIVNNEKIKPVFIEENVNVLDFYPSGKLCYFLLKKKGNYYLQLKSFSKLIFEQEISFIPERLERDFLGNIHIESRDSVYQIFHNEKEVSFQSITQQTFQKELVPLVDAGENYLIRQQNKNHNKRYELVRASKDSIKIIFEQFDLIGQQMAQQQYFDVINLYHKVASKSSNIILLGVWSGALRELAINRELVREIGFYFRLDNEVNCKAIELNNQLFVFDFFEDKILTYLPKTGVKTTENSFNLPKGFKFLFKDLEDKTIYICNQRAGIRNYYRFDNNNSTSFVPIKLTEYKFRYNVKFSNGWIYYQVKNETGNGRVYREKIKLSL